MTEEVTPELPPGVRKLKVLVTVKTYPTLSSTYGELVCTAGITEEGEWIRIYPIPFRKLDDLNRYPKYAWLEFDAIRHTKDFRPQSYRPVDITKIKVSPVIKADGNAWIERRKLVTDKLKTYTNLSELIADSEKDNGDNLVSLALFKPTEVLDFYAKPCEREWDQKRLKAVEQPTFFDAEPFKVVKKIPYHFKYRFKDDEGRESNLMIEDWEVGKLYLNTLADANGDEAEACRKVRQKYFDTFVLKKDLYFFLGTIKDSHAKEYKNPFVIIGAFYPNHKPGEDASMTTPQPRSEPWQPKSKQSKDEAKTAPNAAHPSQLSLLDLLNEA